MIRCWLRSVRRRPGAANSGCYRARGATRPDATAKAGLGGWAAADPVAEDDGGTVLRLSNTELTMLAPRLRPYLTSPRPTLPEVVDAANWLRGELGVSQSLWGEACLAMGCEQAAIALGIVSAKRAGISARHRRIFDQMISTPHPVQFCVVRIQWVRARYPGLWDPYLRYRTPSVATVDGLCST
jgi:hypothetical protein